MTTPGKVWGLRRLADVNGHFTMVAIDQRPPLFQLIAQARGIDADQVTFDDVVAVKRVLAQTLAPHASAMLVDPNWGYPAVADVLVPGRGLLLTLEDHRFVETPRGRRSATIADWTVAKIRCLGADAVKLLAWYRPDADEAARAHQCAWVQSVGRACAEADIAFVLELLVYPFPGQPSQAHPKDIEQHAQRVLDSVGTFADPRFAVDLFKLESPVLAHRLPLCGDTPQAAAAQQWFDRLGATIDVPWVMLSAGATMAAFDNVLRYAYQAGASGFLAGRAIWSEALVAFPDLRACSAALARDAIPYLERLCALTERHAVAWRPDYASLRRIATEGEFARGYPPM